MKTRTLIVLSVIFAFTVGTVSAADIFVRQGSKGKGSKSKPYGALWKAVDRARRGDVIHVAQGVYHGKGGAGHFSVKVPNLTLVGGYNDDFSERNPFKYFTVLERAKDYKGDWTGLPEGIIDGKLNTDHSNLTVDGFVLDGASRNTYNGDKTKILLKGSYKGVLFQTRCKNTKLLNSILLNPCGKGVYCNWAGTENEVRNCFILNWFYCGISTRAAQPDSVIKIKNNTIAFGWFMPGMGGSLGIFVGKQGQTIIEDNVIAFLQGEGDQPGIGVLSGFQNEDTIMKNNVFFSCNGGFYKYMDSDGKNLIVWKNEDFEDLNDEDNCEDYMLSEAEDNREEDPGLQPDKRYATIFANFVGSSPGKLNMDLMNQWRRSVGLPLQASPGTARKNWDPPYPRDKVIPGLFSKIEGVGVQKDGPFESYSSSEGDEFPDSFEECKVADFKKGGKYASGNDGRPVLLKVGIGDPKVTYEVKECPRSDYDCFQLLAPGESSYTRNYVIGYFLKGTDAHSKWLKYRKKKKKYNKKGIYVWGLAYDFKNRSYSYPVGIKVLAVNKKKKLKRKK